MARAYLITTAILCWQVSAPLAGIAGQGVAQPIVGFGPPVVAELGEDGLQRAAITLDSYSFTPDHVVVRVGNPVELTLTSVTIITPHNFVLKEPAAGLNIDQDVGTGDTLTVRFIPTEPGTFTFYCDKKLLFFRSHREKGMEGRLEVQE